MTEEVDDIPKPIKIPWDWYIFPIFTIYLRLRYKSKTQSSFEQPFPGWIFLRFPEVSRRKYLSTVDAFKKSVWHQISRRISEASTGICAEEFLYTFFRCNQCLMFIFTLVWVMGDCCGFVPLDDVFPKIKTLETGCLNIVSTSPNPVLERLSSKKQRSRKTFYFFFGFI